MEERGRETKRVAALVELGRGGLATGGASDNADVGRGGRDGEVFAVGGGCLC